MLLKNPKTEPGLCGLLEPGEWDQLRKNWSFSFNVASKTMLFLFHILWRQNSVFHSSQRKPWSYLAQWEGSSSCHRPGAELRRELAHVAGNSVLWLKPQSYPLAADVGAIPDRFFHCWESSVITCTTKEGNWKVQSYQCVQEEVCPYIMSLKSSERNSPNLCPEGGNDVEVSVSERKSGKQIRKNVRLSGFWLVVS